MRQRGVTLLEVLVAISIILILMGLAFPAYFRALHKANVTHDQMNDHYSSDNPKWTFDDD